jgi:RND family efflux transporter MFP subunit
MTKNKIYIWIFLLGAALCFYKCGDSGQNYLTTNEKIVVKTISTKKEEITPEIRSFGTISHFRKVDVSVITDGIISAMNVEEGDAVYLGQVLAQITNIQLEIQKKRTLSQINQAESALDLSKAKLREAELNAEARFISVAIGDLDLAQKKIELDDLDRALKNKEQVYEVGGLSDEAMHSLRMNFLAEQNKYEMAKKNLEMQKIGLRNEDIINQGYKLPASEAERIKILTIINTQTLSAEVKVAEASLAAARTELEAVNQLLNETVLRAPVTGIVGLRYLEKGERVQADTKLFTIMDIARVFAVFPIEESDASLLTEGMKVEVIVDAFKDQVFEAKIYLVSPLIDPQTGNVTVKAVLDNPGLKLKPGMFLRARVISGEPRQAVLIPKTCLTAKQGKNAEVFTVSQGRIFIKKVVTGVEKEDRVEITRGLNEGETVVDTPSPILKEGQEVEMEK